MLAAFASSSGRLAMWQDVLSHYTPRGYHTKCRIIGTAGDFRSITQWIKSGQSVAAGRAVAGRAVSRRKRIELPLLLVEVDHFGIDGDSFNRLVQ